MSGHIHGEPDYDEIVALIENVPLTWLAGLFFHTAVECQNRGVWAKGRVAQVVGNDLNASIDRAAELLLKAAENMPDTFAEQYRDAAKELRSNAAEIFPGVK